MARKPAAAGAALLLVTAGLISLSPPLPAAAATCSVLFDDFQYSSSADPALTARHWTVRTGGGGPGIPGASWLASNVNKTSGKCVDARAGATGNGTAIQQYTSNNTTGAQSFRLVAQP